MKISKSQLKRIIKEEIQAVVTEEIATFTDKDRDGIDFKADLDMNTFDITNMPVKFSASVKNFEVDKYLDSKEQRKMDLFLQYGMAAAIDAVKDSGIDSDKINLE